MIEHGLSRFVEKELKCLWKLREGVYENAQIYAIRALLLSFLSLRVVYWHKISFDQ